MQPSAGPGGEWADDLVRRFLAGRGERTLAAYRSDLDDFAGFLGQDTAGGAAAQLLGGGEDAGHRLLLDYAVELRIKGRARATVNRRLATLRSLARFAGEAGLDAPRLELPDDDQISAALEARSSATVPYLFPRHPGEVDRLDVQHHALREVLGAYHLAPVGRPGWILDVGSGTGQWAFDMCRHHPDAVIVGFDLVAGKPGRPDRCRWVRGNVLQGLPFADGRFDLVFQRLLVVGVPLAYWPRLVADLVRVARPGGWVELVEPVVGVVGAGPATARFNELALAFARQRGLDTTRVVFDSLDDYLRGAGLVEVVRRQVEVPIGAWGGRVGSFMATDLRAAQARMSEVLQTHAGVSAEECHALVDQAQEECRHLRMSFRFATAFGLKPR